jgi:tetratricopeptide (TPR) repeat protein
LASRGKLSEALESERESRAALERLTKNDPNNALWRGYLQRAIVRTGTLAYDFVKALDFATALMVADEAISLAPGTIWLYGNRAYALMLLGRLDEARALYLRYRGEKVQGDMTWEALILGDFADLRKAGLTHPLMGEIETLFEGPAQAQVKD